MFNLLCGRSTVRVTGLGESDSAFVTVVESCECVWGVCEACAGV